MFQTANDRPEASRRMKTRAPIIPTALRGVSAALPLGSRFPRPCPITIAFGAPIFVPEGDIHDKEFLRRATEDVMSAVQDLLSR